MDPHTLVAQQVLNYRELARAAGAKYGVEPELILGVIHNESGGNPDAFPEHPERDGASFGLMQVELPTARGLGYTGPARLLFDPVVSIDLGTHDLAGGIKDYTNPWVALIDYNGGPGAVRWYRLGYRRGPAVHYANTVWALKEYYARRLKDVATAKGGTG